MSKKINKVKKKNWIYMFLRWLIIEAKWAQNMPTDSSK